MIQYTPNFYSNHVVLFSGQTLGVDQESSFDAKKAQKKPERPEAKTRVKTPAKMRKKETVPQTPPQHENSENADTSELMSSGRPKRRAAKVYVSLP